MSRALVATLGFFLFVLALTFMRHAPPPARGVDAPLHEFSSARAQVVQRSISVDGETRLVGSDGNARGRAALVSELVRAGWTTDTQTTFSCGPHGVCAFVSNIVAVLEGRRADAGAVLLMAHYDSVACSPGASDDGAGASAVVEAARAVAAGPRLERTVVVVLTDGEEAGLLGARAFAKHHPLASRIKAVVNVDSRGSSGPSALFETSAGNAWLVELIARKLTRPVTSSLFYEVYRRMPNDTDFTVVKGLGHGVNFANISGIEHYHTALDTAAHADRGTMQHHGDQALAITRALADAGPELDAPVDRTNDAVWFDVLAFFVVRWPASWTLAIALVALALVIGRTIRMRAWGLGLASAVAALAAAIGASLCVGVALKWLGAFPAPWIAHPLPAVLSLHLASIAAGATAAMLVAARTTPPALWAGTWIAWACFGVATAIVAPGASFLFIVPALAAGLSASLSIEIAAAIPACVAALLWMPIALPMLDAAGFLVPALTCVSTTFLVSALPPLLVGVPRRAPVGPLALSFGLAVVAVVVPPFSVEHPQRVNVVMRQDDGAPNATVFVEAAWAHLPWGKAPAAMLSALGGGAAFRTERPTPWSAFSLASDAPRIHLPAPEIELAETSSVGDERHVRGRVRSARGARTVMLIVPPLRSVEVKVEGQSVKARDGALVFRGLGPAGLDMEIIADGVDAVDVTLLDLTHGISASSERGRAVVAARPREAAQTQEGDLMLAGRRVRL